MIATASSVSCVDRRDPQRVEHRVLGHGVSGLPSEGLEVVERLAARAGRPTATCRPSSRSGWTRGCRGCRTAGSGPTASSGTGPSPAAGGGGATPYAASLALCLVGHPVGGPGRREHELDVDLRRSPRRGSASIEVGADRLHGRAAGVGRRDRHVDAAVGRPRSRRAGCRGPRSSRPAARGRAPGGDRPSARRQSTSASPCRPRVRAGEVLHLGEQVADLLGVEPAPAAAERRAATSGTVERRLARRRP